MAREPENDYNDESSSAASRSAGRLLRDILRKTVSQSQDARQTTEDILKGVLGDVKIPREFSNILLQQADTVRSEIVRVIASEIRNFLEEANLGEELAKILTSISFEIRLEVRFIPNDQALKPNVRSQVKVKGRRKANQDDRPSKINDDGFVETEGHDAINDAIQNRVSSLVNSFLKKAADATSSDDDEPPSKRHTRRPTVFTPRHTQESVVATKPQRGWEEEIEDSHAYHHIYEDESDDIDAHLEHAEEPAHDRHDEERHHETSFRKALSPDLRRYAEVAASQLTSVGRATASRSATTAANAVSAAANRAQAVVRGARSTVREGTNILSQDEIWRRFANPNGPDITEPPSFYYPPEEDNPAPLPTPKRKAPSSTSTTKASTTPKSAAKTTTDAGAAKATTKTAATKAKPAAKKATTATKSTSTKIGTATKSGPSATSLTKTATTKSKAKTASATKKTTTAKAKPKTSPAQSKPTTPKAATKSTASAAAKTSDDKTTESTAKSGPASTSGAAKSGSHDETPKK